MQSCGVVAPGRRLRHHATPVTRARNPPDHASTPQLCMLPRLGGMTAPMVLDGPMNGPAFLAYVE